MYEELVRLERGTAFTVKHLLQPRHYRSHFMSGMHLHSEYEIIRINHGVMRCITANDEFIAKEGDILFINSRTPHSTYRGTYDVYESVVQFKPNLLPDSILYFIMRFNNNSTSPAILFKKGLPETEKLQELLSSIITEYTEKKPLWAEHIQSYIDLLVLTLRRWGKIADTANINWDNIEKIRPVLEYIDNNYAEPLTNSLLAKTLNMNENYLSRLFKNIVGTTLVNYISFVRICKAEALLKDNVDLAVIPYETGFSSQSYFCKTFKKYTQYSPNEYKKMLKKQVMY